MENRIAIIGKYVNRYIDPMDGSLVYLGACETGKDSVLADSFLEKGAIAVIGNSNTILTRYTHAMQCEICLRVLEEGPGTGELYTLFEALAYAQNVHGKTDNNIPYYARVEVFGGTAAESYRSEDRSVTEQQRAYAAYYDKLQSAVAA